MGTNHWLENAKKSLLPLSESQEFRQALKEWKITGDFIDNEQPVEICELCAHPDVRYQYQISNARNSNTLSVGSSCVLRFTEINIYDADGKLLTEYYERKKYLDDIVKQNQKELILNPLRKLWRIDKQYRKYIEATVQWYKVKSGFAPKNIAILFARMRKFNIEYNPRIYPISLRSDSYRIQFYNLDKHLLELVKESLSTYQQRTYLMPQGKMRA